MRTRATKADLGNHIAVSISQWRFPSPSVQPSAATLHFLPCMFGRTTPAQTPAGAARNSQPRRRPPPTTGLSPVWCSKSKGHPSGTLGHWDTSIPTGPLRWRRETETRRRCNCNSSNSPPLLLDLQQKMETPSQPVVVALAHVCCRQWHRDECWSPRGLGVQVTKPGQTARRGSTSPEPSERRPLCDGPSELCIVPRYLGHSRQCLRDISG